MLSFDNNQQVVNYPSKTHEINMRECGKIGVRVILRKIGKGKYSISEVCCYQGFDFIGKAGNFLMVRFNPKIPTL
jgi:hypothetical protein